MVKCNYCGEEFDNIEEEREHRSKHFKNTEKISRKSRKEDKINNIVEKWRRNAENKKEAV